MDSMMYTKEEEYEVALTGGSPWGFTIRTQSGNGYNRGRVIVAKVVQGGKADNCGNIHVGDEILAVNGFQFDNEQQATEYVRDAKKQLILRVKRGQDRRRMNIRLASELPNYYATALEPPLEEKIYKKPNTDSGMFTSGGNNKRSSKEYEKDINYGVASDTANAIIDYQDYQLQQPSSKVNISSSRLTRSTTDLSESSNVIGDQPLEDFMSSLSAWKAYNTPPSPKKVQRVRIRSSNVNIPDHYNCSPGSGRSSPTVEENQKHTDSRSSIPYYSSNVQKPGLEDLNRTWPSVGSPDVAKQDIRLSSHNDFSVSAAKSQFEQISHPRFVEHDFPQEIRRRQSSSTSSLAPKPPSRNSSFRMVTTRLSSSSSTSSVFSDGESTKTSVEKKVFSPSVVVHDSFLENSRNLGSEKDFDAVPVRQGSSSEDLDKPRPPVRFSHSKVLTSFRSSKKPAYQATSSGPSTVYDIRDERLESAPENVYNHIRSQSLPSSKIVAVNVTSKSWMEDRENKHLSLGSEEPSRDQRLPRSSSISRAQTTRVSALHQDDAKSLTHQSKNNFGNYRGEAHSAVIRAMKTEVLFESANKTNTELRSKSTPFLPQDDRNERDKTRTELAVPVLKENSIMQRLLIESQGQGEPRMRSKAAAIKEEITQRTDNTDTATKQTVIKTESVPTVEQQRLVSQVRNSETDENFQLENRNRSTQDVSERENKKNIETAVEQPKKLQTDLRNTKDIKESAVKVDRYLDKLMVKLDSPPVKRHPPPVDVPVEADTPSADDEVFQKPVNSETESSTCMAESETQSNENTVERSESAVVNLSSDVVSVNNERNCEIGNFSPEVIVKTDESGADVESCLPAQVKDGNDNISESDVPDETEHQMNGKTKKSLELKDESHQGKPPSPSDVHLKVIHNRENSASSILEETLESAKTIASIYSVEGPARSATGEDSLCTASEMRRYSLAKHVLRKRPKAETEISTTRKTETTGELDESLSTPERASNPSSEASLPVENETDMDESGNRSAGSTSSNGSRRSSGIISPKIEALEEQKEILISSMKKKVELLKEQENEVNEEMKQNDELGDRVADVVKAKTSTTEFSKFKLFVGELNNIIGLLLSLTQRMHRYEVMLQDIDLAEDNGREKRDNLLKRMDRVKQQYEEACTIKEINDKRGEAVAKFVEEYCSDEEFADFQHFVDMKTQLALTQAEIRDKVKLGEEKLNALTSAQIDWNSFDLNSK